MPLVIRISIALIVVMSVVPAGTSSRSIIAFRLGLPAMTLSGLYNVLGLFGGAVIHALYLPLFKA
jgi:hypothetical protein